jgi:four helix bundle protein
MDDAEQFEHGFEKLRVWVVAMEVAEELYAFAETLPPAERFGLSSQIQRAAASIPSNIAEGWGRGKGPANVQFARIARGSLYEVMTLVTEALRIKKGDPDLGKKCLNSLSPLRRLLQAYISSMEAKS